MDRTVIQSGAVAVLSIVGVTAGLCLIGLVIEVARMMSAAYREWGETDEFERQEGGQ